MKNKGQSPNFWHLTDGRNPVPQTRGKFLQQPEEGGKKKSQFQVLQNQKAITFHTENYCDIASIFHCNLALGRSQPEVLFATASNYCISLSKGTPQVRCSVSTTDLAEESRLRTAPYATLMVTRPGSPAWI